MKTSLNTTKETVYRIINQLFIHWQFHSANLIRYLTICVHCQRMHHLPLRGKPLTLYTTVSAFKSVTTQMKTIGAFLWCCSFRPLYVSIICSGGGGGILQWSFCWVDFWIPYSECLFPGQDNERSEFHNIGSHPFQHFSICKKPHN